MTKPLLMTSLCAFVAAVAFFVLALVAVASGGGRHRFDNNEWMDTLGQVDGGGPAATRDLTWSGGDELAVRVPADVVYTQGALTPIHVTGPRDTLAHLVVDDGVLKFDRKLRHPGRLQIVMAAPSVTEFVLAGHQTLRVQGYTQEKLEATIAGSGDLIVAGSARKAELTIAGSGDINAGDLTGEQVEVSIAGSGDAVIAPTQKAEVTIAGSGDVTLKTNPPRVETSIMGSGKVIRQP